MSKEVIYPKGIRVFKPHASAPSYVKGTMVITLDQLEAFMQENRNLLHDYNGSEQLKLQVLEGRDGLYLTVDTYKKGNNNNVTNDLPY